MSIADESSTSGTPLKKVLPGGFTPSYWEVSQIPTVPLRALGLHTYLMSLPDNWNISAERIAKVRCESVNTIRKAMRELQEHGLLEVKNLRNTKGQLRKVIYIFGVANSQVRPKHKKPTLGKTEVRESVVVRRETLRRDIPPPTSSTSTTEELNKNQEEERTTTKKSLALAKSLNFYDQTPTNTELARLGSALAPWVEKLADKDIPALKRILQKNVNVGTMSIVAVYLSRIKTLKDKDFEKHSPERKKFTDPWCGSCSDPQRRHTINDGGYIMKPFKPCQNCGTRVETVER